MNLYKLVLLMVIYMFPFQVMASQLRLPPIEIEKTSPSYNKKKERYECFGSRLKSERNKTDKEMFSLYLLYYTSADSNRKAIPSHIKLYESMHKHMTKELISDNEIMLSKASDGVTLVTLPFHKSIVWDQWLRRLTTERNNIQMKICKLDWFDSQAEKLSHIPMDFLTEYNALLSSYEALVDRCKKPDIKGWTQSQEAIDFANCQNNAWRREHNQKLRELKSYRSLRRRFVPILTELGLIDKLKTPRKEYLK